MGTIALTHTFSDGQTITAAKVNTNFTDITSVVNGGLDTSNLSTKYAPYNLQWSLDAMANSLSKTMKTELSLGSAFIPTKITAHSSDASAGTLTVSLQDDGSEVITGTSIVVSSSTLVKSTSFDISSIADGSVLTLTLVSNGSWNGGFITVTLYGKTLVRT